MSTHADNGMNELDLQSALHVLVHPNMGLAVRIVKRPGAELIDIALIIPEYLIHSLRERSSLLLYVGFIVSSTSLRHECGQLDPQLGQ